MTAPSPLDRRQALRLGAACLGGAVLAGSCRSPASPTVEAGDAATVPYRLVATFPTGVPYVAAGAVSRLPLQVALADGTLLDELPDDVSVTVWRDGRQVGDAVVLQPQPDGTEAPYLALETTFDVAVDHEIRTRFRDRDLSVGVAVYDPADVATPQVGEPMPSTATPTTEQPLSVDPICTLTPTCPLHDTSLDVALGGGPVALVVGSAEYCLDQRCGPTLGTFVRTAGGFPTVRSIHAEPYRNPKAVPKLIEADPTELVELLGVSWEPAIFFVGRDGRISARADSIAGEEELRGMFSRIA